MNFHPLPGPAEAGALGTEKLRDAFLVGGLFRLGEVTFRYTGLDRMIAGAALPGPAPLRLPDCAETGTAFFLERRELGILNLGAPGVVEVGAALHELVSLDCLYVGRGERDVAFANGAAGAAQFYLVSAPAHAAHPTAVARRAALAGDPIGSAATANRRRITKCIHPGGIASCQLVMGFTELEAGSVWNTMPPHTHGRRSEIYLYFDLGEQRVVHLMGEPAATRHLIVGDREAVLSPPWSIHCGAGTGSYRFVWAMAGENQEFSDMDPAPLAILR